MKTIALTLVAPAEEFMDFAARSISVPGEAGYLGVMPGHVPVIAKLKVGLVHIVTAAGEDLWYGVTGGFFEMIESHATLLADEIITPAEARDLPPEWEGKGLYYPEKFDSQRDKANLTRALLRRKLDGDQ